MSMDTYFGKPEPCLHELAIMLVKCVVICFLLPQGICLFSYVGSVYCNLPQ